MAILNVTYRGLSADLPSEVEEFLSDDDIRALAVEVVRSGGLPGLHAADIGEGTFRHFVVDRFTAAGGGQRIYLRPKVPFGR
ncbi:hypothetical protein F4561_002560 [Lipingzhangella halophila]|uniref:Uncharacterized protein n=1 Tax=Lipingzhangella halophila TaxID=1783352 RepID=A0A7W7W3H8_9ACTN|nr:hypothetical protein [Lipingzhangella halophila]MBB4931740.1 hypothetical protein [Lipingzhangella halophila]